MPVKLGDDAALISAGGTSVCGAARRMMVLAAAVDEAYGRARNSDRPPGR
jgi:uncharacterized membrane protein YadS